MIGAEFDGARLAEDASIDTVAAPDAVPEADPGDAPTLLDAGAFDAAFAGDLQLWLAANEGVVLASGFDAGPPDDGSAADGAAADDGGPPNGVGQWTDLSLHGHGGAQSDPAHRPLLVPNALAGMPVLRFERDRGTCLRSTWTAAPGGKAATAFVVTRGDPTSLLRFQGGSVPGAFVFPFNSKLGVPDAAPELNVFLDNPPEQRLVRVDHHADAWQVTTTRVVVATFGGVETWRNGTLSEKGTFSASALPSVETFGIGCYAGELPVLEFANADVAEILFYASALPDPQRIAVERYLTLKWKL